MQSTKSVRPVLPAAFALPLKIVPAFMHRGALVIALNKILKIDLMAGDLDFLDGRSVSIKVHDMAVTYRLTLSENKLKIYDSKNKCDLSIQATLYDFMMLVSRQEDPDTLVFQRRLVMEGDTELGLSLKNYLDGIDVESSKLLLVIETLVKKTLPIYRRVFG